MRAPGGKRPCTIILKSCSYARLIRSAPARFDVFRLMGTPSFDNGNVNGTPPNTLSVADDSLLRTTENCFSAATFVRRPGNAGLHVYTVEMRDRTRLREVSARSRLLECIHPDAGTTRGARPH